MSDRDKPVNPFGRNERTIIRPNPGGRLPPAPQPPYSPAPDFEAPRAPFSPSPLADRQFPSQQAPSPQYQPVPPPPFAAAPTTPASEDWISTQNQPPARPELPAAAPLRVDDMVAPNANPIMRAAGPLLQLLGRLRVALLRASFASLMEQVADAVKFFEKDIRSAGVSEQQANTAKYILCATADDIVQHIPTDDRHVWAQYSMLSRFFGERVGGVRFFEILDRLKVDPLANYSVLELQHACLALGFQGMHRASAGGVPALQVIQRNLYELLRQVRPKQMRDLSPHWRGQALAGRQSRITVPTWLVASVAAALLFAGFITLRTWLTSGAERTAQLSQSLHPSDKIELKRKIIAPPPPPPPPPPPADRITQLQRIRNALAAENTPCKMTADQTASFIVIRVCNLILFDAGKATVLDAFRPVAARLAVTLEKEPGKIRVVGHTDNTPISNTRFPTNYVLSLERAKAVAAVLKQGLTNQNRVEVEGKAADVPIDTNATPEGRAKNRRVEILIERSE
ncbi:type VI secretion system protein TssL, long form [Bradyrhizobium jicamae]|uniref:type VI secretion system protein TssL, long form n=1 Tax=Bradyrhizobium jicamae TaxID=280332 RepID=UPI001BAD7823|nr:type VI secretion system protein TssL, long form [Bradyrhizobium jicamae]MBR0936621.1 type VI secretion system protein TssL, long form [Bradyrhizobium jicamae]